MDEVPKKKLKAHHVGIAGVLSLISGYYGFPKLTEFFYTRKEAMIQVKRIDEMKDDREKLFEKLIEVDEKVSKIQGMLEIYFAKKQMMKSRVYTQEEFKNKTNGG